MAIIAKLVAMLGLDSVAFDAGMNRARASTRGFGEDVKGMARESAFASVHLAGAFMKIHSAARLFDQAATFGAVLVRSLEEGAFATADFVDAIYKIPLGIGEAIKSVVDLEYEITGEGAAMRKVAADTAEFVKQTSRLGAARKEIEALAAIGEGARAGAAMIGLEGLDKQLAEIEARAAKKRGDVNAHAASGTLGALGYAGPTAAKSALEDIEGERAKAEAGARRQDAMKRGEPGWTELTKANTAYEQLRLSAEDYRRLELSMLDIESSMAEKIIERESAVAALALAQEQADAAITAALPDYDAILTAFDEMVAGEKALADEAEDLEKSLRSPWQVLQDEVDKYTMMLNYSLITQEEFDKAVQRAGGGLSPNRGGFALITEGRQYGALPGGGDTVPSLLRNVLVKIGGSNTRLDDINRSIRDGGGLS